MSIKERFLYSIAANLMRGVLSLIVGLLVARALGPADYGNLAYLLGSFWAIRALLDMGASSAFYTFIAGRNRGRLYYLMYFGWLASQFLFSVVFVALILPSVVVDRFWLGQERDMILLALLATFLQNQVWQTVVQIHEAVRKTILIQVVGLAIISIHLLVVVLMIHGDWLSIRSVLWAMVAEYLAVAAWSSRTLREAWAVDGAGTASNAPCMRTVFSEYLHYCRPMVVIAVFSFFYEMVDRWLLQRFGGASQQAFYQVASQLSTISLLATASFLNILWKEVAEACARGDHSRIFFLYQKTVRVLVMLAAVVACFLAPWSEELVSILLGSAYHSAWPVLLIMLFYPIHQAMGQANSTLFMATGRTGTYMIITVVGLLISMPFSYLLIAPTQGAWPAGLEMGAMGLAIKTVGLNILGVNVQYWIIARHYGAAFEWRYQVFGISGLTMLGYGVWFLVQGLMPDISGATLSEPISVVLIRMASAGLIYLAGVLMLFVWVPAMTGLDQHEVKGFLAKMTQMLRRKGVAK